MAAIIGEMINGRQEVTEIGRSLPNRKSTRLSGYDYRHSGLYFVTICAHRKACLFGEIRAGKMILNELGKTAERCWQLIPQTHASVALDRFVVMPNHLHGIIAILDSGEKRFLEPWNTSSARSLGTIVGQFKRAVTLRSKRLAQSPEQPL